jgi:hypothetical protein
MAAARDGHSANVFEVDAACSVACCHALWEPGASGPVLRRRMADCRRLVDNPNTRIGSSYGMLGRMMAELAVAALRVDEAETVAAYCAWLQAYALSPPSTEDRIHLKDLAKPLWLGQDLPFVQETARVVFESEDSRWNPVHRTKPSTGHRPEEFAFSPLISVAPFRRQLLRLLADETEVGQARVEGNVTLQVKVAGWTSNIRITAEDDDRLPARTAAQPVRACDLYAWRLSKIAGAPRFELYWPPMDRDAALIRCREFLTRWGAQYTGVSPKLSRDEIAQIRFDRLDRPATPADVAAGHAIFSFEKDKEPQVVDLQTYPQPARWKTLDDPRLTSPHVLSKPGEAVRYDLDGAIWQAEQILEEGERRTYYGFVGRHVIARVPADEIEFLPPQGR